MSWPSLSRYRLSTLLHAALRLDRRLARALDDVQRPRRVRAIYTFHARPAPASRPGIPFSILPSSLYCAAASLTEAVIFIARC